MRGTVKVVTIGCKANFADSTALLREAVSLGYRPVEGDHSADVVVINSCTVTHRADRDNRAAIRRARRENPAARIVVTGCQAATDPAGVGIPEADAVVKPNDMAKFKAAIGGGPEGDADPLSEHSTALLLGHHRSFVKIQNGCDSACAYCIVPLARGPNSSLPLDEAVTKVVACERDGAGEVVLTGIHVGAYANDRGVVDGLAALLRAIIVATSHVRIRLGSIEPMEATDTLLDAMASSPRVCRHLHIPVQSGSDAVLARMLRPYRVSDVADRIAAATRLLPGVSIGVDLMVGFPGETAADFDATVAFVERVPLAYLHPFSFSSRAGTAAASMPDHLPSETICERAACLQRLDSTTREIFARRCDGTAEEILVESHDPATGLLTGHTGNYLMVTIPGTESEIGSRIGVVLVSSGPGCAAARRVVA